MPEEGFVCMRYIALVLVKSEISFTRARLQNFRSRSSSNLDLDHHIFYSNLIEMSK